MPYYPLKNARSSLDDPSGVANYEVYVQDLAGKLE